MSKKHSISEYYSKGFKVLLTGTGRQFVERIGVEATRQVVAGVLTGQNIREQTEPLTRRRVTQVAAGVVALFARGMLEIPDFDRQLSQLALSQLDSARRSDKAEVWLAQWLIGLTGKGYQNVLSSNPGQREAYISAFEQAIADAAAKCKEELGDIRLSLGFIETPSGEMVDMNWQGIARLTTAIGCATLTLRGSEKAMYGKLFERLVLGSVLSVLGFRHVDVKSNKDDTKVFWLADASDSRECDATAINKPGKLARFDIGFIGPGNSEISKDKLSRYARVAELGLEKHSSKTFIVVDRLPATSKTQQAAGLIDARIIQMSMKYWPRELAQHLADWFETDYELVHVSDADFECHIRDRLREIPLQNFLSQVSIGESGDGGNGEG